MPVDKPQTFLNWQKADFSEPFNGHFVQFYHYDHGLIGHLEEFIAPGLRRGDSCIVIATQNHLLLLEQSLTAAGLNLPSAKRCGQYVALDAEAALARFMVKGQPDRERFWASIGSLVSFYAGRGRPIRAFGEMVALLWKTGNLQGALKLEGFWNELAKKHSFTLFCAYPQNHFDMDIHRPAIDEISRLHSHVTVPA